jgi:riboflavin synthase
MFTGLIKDIGRVKSITPNATGKEFYIETKLIKDIEIDDSIAVNGVCLTATRLTDKGFYAQSVHITLEKTTTGQLRIDSKVNLELALRPMDRLGGHFVQGHINGVAKVSSIKQLGNNYEVTLTPPKVFMKYFISEGSIGLDGISLTLARVTQNDITVSVIPHTWNETILYTKTIGAQINIEVDMFAKYIENFLNLSGMNKNREENLKNKLMAFEARY